jgi:hypothetical protein
MSYLDIYRQRVLANGEKSTDTIINASKETIKNNLNNSLFTETFLVNGIEYSGLVTQGKTSDEKKLLFLPDVKIDIGSVVELKSKFYLIMDFLSEGINEIYPTATLRLTNSTYPIQSGNKTREIMGYDQFGKPLYSYVYEINKNVPCIVESGIVQTDTNAQLVIPKNTVYVTLQYQTSETLIENYEFTMYNNKYKIKDIDYTKVINDKGIIKIIAEREV